MIALPENLFPSRPLKATRTVFDGAAWMLFSILLFLGLAVAFAMWQAPGLWRDIQIAQNPIEVRDFDILDGECRTQRAIFTTCEADLRYSYEGKTIESHTSFAFVDFSTSDYYVGVVISGDRPAMATLDLGLDMLWNRLAVGAVVMALLVGLSIAGIVGFLRASRGNRRARQGGRVRPVALQITQNKKVLGGRSIAYAPIVEGKKKATPVSTRFSKKSEPILLNGDDGMVYAVGAQMEGVRHPILLDNDLTRLDFTEAERMNFNTALDAGSASAQREAEGAPA